MDEEGFRAYLRRGGRSSNAVQRCIRCTADFEHYLRESHRASELDGASQQDLESFVEWIECEPQASAKTHLWALRYYYGFAGFDNMSRIAASLRKERIRRVPFSLTGFRGVDPENVRKLNEQGIGNVEQMLKAGRTPSDRKALAAETGVPEDSIVELVKLSDLARIPGVKGVRARLYYDAGLDTVEKLAGREPDELRVTLAGFVKQSGLDGLPPLPKELAFTVDTARCLETVVEF